MAFVFEGDLDLGAVKLNLAVADSHVLRHDLRYAQLAQMFSGLLDHVLGSVFPAFGASADEFDNVVNAFGMDKLASTWRLTRLIDGARIKVGHRVILCRRDDANGASAPRLTLEAGVMLPPPLCILL